jgi:signal transduction histidine kinase/ActR/RegA family two-component response regulator
MKLSTRLASSFIAIGAITTLLGAFALARLGADHDAVREVVQVRLPSSRLIAAMDAELAKIRMAELQLVLSTTPGQRKWYVRDADNLLAALAHDEVRYEPLIASPEERALYKAFRMSWDSYLAKRAVVLTLSMSGQPEPAKAIMRGPSQTAFDRASSKLQELIELTVQAGADATARSEAKYSLSRTVIMSCLAAALLGGIVLAVLLMRAITIPLRALVGATERIGGGDLTARVAIDTRDELGSLGAAFNGMATALRTAQDTLEERVASRTAELHVAKEAHREARVAAERANLTKSEFLANMSHELRTPLNSVIGFADILMKNKRQAFDEKELAYVGRIQANGRHLLGLINSVLDLSKVESGRLELELTSVPLAQLAKETLSELDAQAQLRGIRLVGEYPNRPCVVETDRSKLKQILINLVGNALKFCSEGEVRVVVVANPVSGKPLRIDVIDTGIGIPAERLESIFEAFLQAESSTTRRFGGTGLGLTISRSLAQLMGFDVTVASEVGKGSTFSVVFAAAAKSTATGTPRSVVAMSPQLAIAGHAEGAPEDDAPFLVLIIDDESDARTILRQSFEDLGCAVVTAASVDEGMALARTVEPSMITVDLMMPRKNGWDALRELQADPLLRHIPVVVVSAVASEGKVQVFGALDYLDKPVTREKLAHVLRRSAMALYEEPLLSA